MPPDVNTGMENSPRKQRKGEREPRLTGVGETPLRPDTPGPEKGAPKKRRTAKVDLLQSDRLHNIRAAGALYDAAAVAGMLGCGPDEVAVMAQDDRLLALPIDDGSFRFPACQFVGDHIVAGLAEVLRALPNRNAWFRLSWLVHVDGVLGGKTPIDVLRRFDNDNGAADRVVSAARAVGEMGT